MWKLLKRQTTYGRVWDRYVKRAFPQVLKGRPYAERKLAAWRVLNTTDLEYQWPGDEWGDRAATEVFFDEAVTTNLPAGAAHLCELGAGAGRYTVVALERFGNSTVHSFDVSPEFERQLRARCRQFVESGRLKTYLLAREPMFLAQTLREQGLAGKVDGIYSFDAMVHVDLHTLLVYWLSATKVLREGGLLAMNVADACSERGFLKLVHDARSGFVSAGAAGGHFMWISQEIVDKTLRSLGFDVTFLKGNGRDLAFAARLADPERSTAALEEAEASWFVQ